MRIAMLGAGNVAMHFSKALINAGNSIVQVWSRDHSNAIDLASQIGSKSIANIVDISDDVDLVIVAVSDDAISVVSSQVLVQNSRIVVHTSGSTDILALNTHVKCGVLYPLQTFSTDADLDFSVVPLCVEGSNVETQNFLLNLANQLSKKTQIVNSVDRIKLHISAVFACNFTNHLYAVAKDLMSTSSLDFELLKPLINETVKKMTDSSPESAQTGPARRNDEITMDKQLKMLESKPDLHQLYRLISQSIVKMYTVPKSPAK